MWGYSPGSVFGPLRAPFLLRAAPPLVQSDGAHPGAVSGGEDDLWATVSVRNPAPWLLEAHDQITWIWPSGNYHSWITTGADDPILLMEPHAVGDCIV